MTTAAASDVSRSGYSARYKRRVIALLTLAYALNAADRTLIAIIAQPLKADLRLSDAQLGLLMGTAFATLYAVSGLPIARLAERSSRVRIMSWALAVWSCLTALCAFAGGFPQLLLIRMGVGVGEAGCTPPAHSLICDYVAPERRSTALSIYSCGISLGYILSALAGGYVSQHFGWRSACLVVGLPGVLLAILLRRWIAEPPRGYSEPDVTHPLPPRFSLAAELAELVAAARQMSGQRGTGHVIGGIIVATFAAQGSYAFIPAFFKRAFELDYATIGVLSALTGGLAVGFGLVCGGLLTDSLGSRHPRWQALVPGAGLMLSTPFYLLSLSSTDWSVSAWLLAIAGFFQYLSFGPTFGMVQNAVEVRRRATATALIYIVLTVIGLGCGPLFTGWLIDRLAQFNFNHPQHLDSAASLWRAFWSTAPGDLAYRESCLARQPLSSDLQGACGQALTLASRQGISFTVLLYLWAALHYLFGAAQISAPGQGTPPPGVGIGGGEAHRAR